MKWVVIITILGVATAQKLFFKPHVRLQAKETDGVKKTGYFYTSRKTAVELAPKIDEQVVMCPDNKSACPSGNTCCLISATAYGCCKLPTAVCCPDKKHCCPFKSICDETKGECRYGGISISWLEKTEAIPLSTEDKPKTEEINMKVKNGLSAVICPDGEHMCQDGQTCCKNDNGFACCPFKNAVCCSDEVHCCPENSKCNIAESKCEGGGSIFQIAPKQQSKLSTKNVSVWVNSVVCPDGTHECPDGNTCCKLASGDYGCCPLPKAVCCDDHIHCCPHEYTCDVSKGTCEKGDLQTEWFEKTPARQVNSVVCPDGTHECPDGNTCCKLASGDYGCCPLPKAVCCDDHIHCCPHEYTCDVSKGTCEKGDLQTEWFEKTPARQVNSVVCPDGTHECPDGNTCCKLASGDYGCCPLPKAVCCDDHIHCCPHEYTCDVSKGTCEKGDLQTEWFEKTPARQVNSVVCPDGTHECPDGNTCCKLASGDYGCCPLPKAVCCDDHIHCCPHEYTCDVSKGTCEKGDLQTEWFEKTPARQVNSVVCPDGTHECPDGNTCCKLASGDYGCCPLPKALCCDDHIHCCPHEYTCDVSKGTCEKGDLQTEWFEKTPARQVNSVVCPDGTHECPDGNTCCKLASGDYGCCPLPKAVCCDDHIHCCPHEYTCDVSKGTCEKGDLQTEWFEKTPARQVNSVVCPDGTHECPDGNTCCKLASGDYGCCPLPKAVCCDDHIHCCPHEYTCDVSKGTCEKGDLQTEWFEKTPARPVNSVVCPDGTHECPDGNTCCKLASGDYGCCPLPKAVCCDDHIHCCPHEYTCDVSKGTCEKGDLQTEWFEKTPARQVNSVVCPDGTHECPNGNTCCKLSSGDYGCCPLPKAVCCDDHIHCCPHEYTCDVSKGTCEKGDLQTEWFEKTPARRVNSVVCPDGTHECPDGNTCCKLASGDYGCCPLPKAVCCDDHIHCCPHEYTCDVSKGTCEKGDLQTEWFEKTPARQVNSVVCPDGTHECPDGNTCCKLASGDYGCCPLPKAVCCDDHIHCCPREYTCDVSKGTCEKGDLQTEWFEKTPARQVNSVVCPDGTHECPDGNTCCKLASGDYGCCPLPKAVCCDDHIHCCPHEYTCDVSKGTCEKGDLQTEWFEKTPARQVNSVVCPDGTHECPDGNTCCKLASGAYGCCPLPKAVCCDDHIHCCPHEYTCDVSKGTCEKGDLQTEWFEKTPARQVNSVVCPDGTHECPDGNTCCKLSSGDYGCCPLPKAVCCDDHIHCCPHEYTCDVSKGTCEKGDLWTEWFEKTPARQVNSVVCPDGTHECPDGNTCCKLASGDYGCCPLPKAVCCDDHIHCCPHKYTCDVSKGTCEKGDLQTEWFEKTPARQVNSVVCPDGTHECPDGNTCCKLASGDYGCCPLPKAVCCDDHIHCCPHEYTCDVSKGTCEKGDLQTEWFEKTPARQVNSVVCPDGTHECPDGNTCCKLASGDYGCCPLPKAVCCSDHVHCCPHGYACDVSQGTCKKGDLQTEWFVKTSARQVNNVVCPDGQSECPDGNTCCKLASGQYGCCPLPKAVCCSDGVHCCPNGYTCDVSKGTCEKGDLQTEWFEKTPARQVNSVVCPDGTHECPDGNTCCKLASGDYGCCPLPKAVCCNDHVHCCPHGYTCDVSQGTCKKGDLQTEWFVKTLARQVNSVVCPGGQSQCPDGNTCCKLASGQYGCCPLPKAVCCSDHVHCCPHNTKCDLSTGMCIRGDLQFQWFEKAPASPRSDQQPSELVPPNPVKCEGGQECPTGNTCCRLSSGEWGCCPLPNAVCCEDQVHCCPHGEKCDPSMGKCLKGSVVRDWFVKTPARHVEKTVCPGGEFECENDQTCCQDMSGRWNCCPMKEAVCCEDHLHCCPKGTKCDKSGKCMKGGIILDSFRKSPAKTRVVGQPADAAIDCVYCPDGSECPDGCTCCKMSDDSVNDRPKVYGCCPLPSAVCCEDHKHCCPQGYVCNMTIQACTKKDLQFLWMPLLEREKQAESIPVKTPGEISCPGDKLKCPDLNTCCEDGKGGYFCCSENNAICCKDHKNCCPHGYYCDDTLPGICHMNDSLPLSSTLLQRFP